MQSAAKDVQYFQLPILGSALVTSWYISTLESYNYDSEKQSGLNTELTCDHNYIISQAKKGYLPEWQHCHWRRLALTKCLTVTITRATKDLG